MLVAHLIRSAFPGLRSPSICLRRYPRSNPLQISTAVRRSNSTSQANFSRFSVEAAEPRDAWSDTLPGASLSSIAPEHEVVPTGVRDLAGRFKSFKDESLRAKSSEKAGINGAYEKFRRQMDSSLRKEKNKIWSVDEEEDTTHAAVTKAIRRIYWSKLALQHETGSESKSKALSEPDSEQSLGRTQTMEWQQHILYTWVTNFDAISQGREPLDPDFASKAALPPVELFSETLLHDFKDVDQMREAWEALHPSQDESSPPKWLCVMLDTLHQRRDKASQVLEALVRPEMPVYAVHDSCQLIAEYLQTRKYQSRSEREWVADQILRLLRKILDTYADKDHGLALSFLQKSLEAFIPVLPPRHLVELMDMTSHPLDRKFRLRVAARLARHTPFKRKALSILQELPKPDEYRKHEYAHLVTSLIRREGLSTNPSSPWDGATEFFYDALEYLRDKVELEPNNITIATLVDTLGCHGDVEGALQVAAEFAEVQNKKESGSGQLDIDIFRLLFRWVKQSSNAKCAEEALKLAPLCPEYESEIYGNALHCVLNFAELESRARGGSGPWILPVFPILLQLYARHFNLQALQPWIPDDLTSMLMSPDPPRKFAYPKRWDFPHTVVPVIDRFFSASDTKKMYPTSTTIATMIRAYLLSLKRMEAVTAYAEFFRSLLESQGPNAVLAKQLIREKRAFVHDVLLTIMMQRASELPNLSVPMGLFGDMIEAAKDEALKDKDADRGKKRGQAETKSIHPPPSPVSFHVIIHGMMLQKQSLFAQRTLQLMGEMGVPMGLAHYNIVLKYHASQQNVAESVQTLLDIEKHGLEPDEYTYKAFSRLEDQESAIAMLENIIESNRQKLGVH